MSRSHRRRRRAIGIVAAVAAWTGSATGVGGFAAPGGRGVGRRPTVSSTVTATGTAARLVRATTRCAAVGVTTVGGWMVTTPAYANEDWDDDDDDDDGALFDDGFFDEDVEEDDEDDEDEDADADVSRLRVGETVETTRPTTSGSGSDAWDAVEAVEIDDEGMDADDDDDDGSDARDGDAVDGEGGGKKSALEDLVELGGTQARALLRDLFVEASKFGIDMDGDDDDSDDVDDDDDDDDEFQEEEDAETLALAAQAEAAYAASTELHAVEYDEEEDDSENERTIEQRKKLLLGLGVDVDSEPTPAVVEEATRESNEPEVVVAAAKPVEEVKSKVRVDPAKVVEPTRGRSLLSVSDPESYKWLTWDDLPAKIRNRVEAPAQEQADVRVVRVGGYWRAASVNNRQRRKSKSRNGFPLRKSEQDDTPLKECNQRHSVSHIQCFGDNSRYAIITVDAKHSFLPGDYVTFERIDAQNAMHARDINRQYRVWALPTKADADVSKLNWDNIWAASPLATSRQSVFAVAFDTPGVSCDAYPGMNSIVRRSANPRLPYC